jgi:hypothetical protein
MQQRFDPRVRKAAADPGEDAVGRGMGVLGAAGQFGRGAHVGGALLDNRLQRRILA